MTRTDESLGVVVVGKASDHVRVAEEALAQAGLHVTRVGDRAAAIEVLDLQPVHVCLVDLSDADVVRTIRAIRLARPRLVVLGLADAQRADVAALGLQAGCTDVLAQPLETADLAVVLANAREARPLAASSASGDADDRPPELIGPSASIRRFNELLDHASAAHCHVLLVAERGLDAEAVAREIHRRSRTAGRFVALDCADGDAALETVLFGAGGSMHGRNRDELESAGAGSVLLDACGGTLFLGGISELPASLQTRLARVARDRELRVAGSDGAGPQAEDQTVPFDARLITAALPTVEIDVEDGRFRPDLYRRLSVLRLTLPPLRDRPDDVPALVTRMSRTLANDAGVAPRRFTSGALTVLAALPWPGNLEELSSVLTRVLAAPGPPVIGLDELLLHVRFDGSAGRITPNGPLSVARARFEREYIAAVLHRHRWRMADAAKALGIQRPNLYRKTRQLGIARTKPLP